MHANRTSPGPLSAEHLVLGRAARELRTRTQLTQEALGTRAGMHRNYVGAIERGEVNPTFTTLLTLTSGLEVELSELVVLYERRRAERHGARHG